MPKTRCEVCGRQYAEEHGTTSTSEYIITFTGVCVSCGSTLSRALAGMAVMLREAHGEKQERVLAKLMDKLWTQGFDTTNFRRSG